MEHNVLILLANEQSLFDALSADLQDGWKTTQIEPCYEDPKDLFVRYKKFAPTSSSIHAFVKNISPDSSSEDIMKHAAEFPLDALSFDEMTDLFFVLGSKVVSAFIQYGLRTCETDEDVEAVATLSHIRKALFTANKEYCYNA